MTVHAEQIRSWERAEIVRSRVEAAQTAESALVAASRTRRRYLQAAADTPFPLEYAFHLVGDVNGKTVLDFGCGSGGNSVLLALRGARVWGLDISDSLLRLARRRLAANDVRAALLVGSAHELPMPDASVDLVFGIAILHHLDLDRVGQEVRRVLKPGGRAIFQEPIRNSAAVRAVRRLIPYRGDDVSPYERPLTTAELQRFGAGLARGRSRMFALPHVSVARAVPPLRRTIDACYRLDRQLLQAFPRLAKFAGIAVFELVKRDTSSGSMGSDGSAGS
jgi:SAM-dependent methyltransferase